MSLPYLFFNYTFLFIMIKVEGFKPQKENCNVHTSHNVVPMLSYSFTRSCSLSIFVPLNPVIVVDESAPHQIPVEHTVE